MYFSNIHRMHLFALAYVKLGFERKQAMSNRNFTAVFSRFVAFFRCVNYSNVSR